jgi:hypothetical protein
MYLPWAGYFGLIHQADTFVFYDDVQFVRRSWQRRNKIKVPGDDFTWLTVPVDKDFGQLINEVSIKDDGWRDSHWKSIHHSYANAQHYASAQEAIEHVYTREWDKLVNLNVCLIKEITQLLDLDVEFKFSSELDTRGEKTERLLSVLESIEADEYVSGPAAKDYIDTDRFSEAGIDLYWHEFDHPEYEQLHGEFVSHLSVLDLIFNIGTEQTTEAIEKAESTGLTLAR